MAEPENVQIGSVLSGTYEVVELLGRGGMGTVWTANHLRLPGKRVAIKVLTDRATAEGYARFRREAEIASRLGHPNIVEVLDWNTLPDGTPYIVLERLQGESLAARLRHGPLSLPATRAIVYQLGSALNAAHRAGIVHRDLKPDNVFLCPRDTGGDISDHVKVLDFGVSKIKDSSTIQTQESKLLGTPQYMSPEQALGKNQEIDPRTDLFALGAIVYEMLSGRPPFDGDSLAGVLFKVVYVEPTPLTELIPDLPGLLGAAVHRAMAKDQNQRYSDVAAFVTEFTGRRSSIEAVPIAPATPVEVFATTMARSELSTLDRRPDEIDRPRRIATEPSSTRGGADGRPHSTTPPLRRHVWVAIGALVSAAAGVAIALALLVGPANTSDAGGATRTLDAPRLAELPLPTPPRLTAPDASVREPARPDAPPRNTAPPSAHSPAKPLPPRPPPPLSEEVREDLRQAETALQAGNYNDAIRLARKTVSIAPNPSYELLVLAYCGKHELGNVKANLINVRSDKARLKQRCNKMGNDFDL